MGIYGLPCPPSRPPIREDRTLSALSRAIPRRKQLHSLSYRSTIAETPTSESCEEAGGPHVLSLKAFSLE